MEDKKVEQFYTPPPKLSKWEGFKVFLWNSETGQFLGRTGASWGKFSIQDTLFPVYIEIRHLYGESK